MLSFFLKSHLARVAALWLDRQRTATKVHLIVNVVASPGIRGNHRRVDWAAFSLRVGEQKVGRNDTVWAAQCRLTENWIQNGKSPRNALGDVLLSTTKYKRSDGIDTLVDIAKERLYAQIGGPDLRSCRYDDVAGVYVDETINDSVNSTIGYIATVPVFRPALRDVLELLGFFIVLGADDTHDALIIWYSACTISAIGEEARVKGKGAEGNDLREGKVVEEGVVVLAETGGLGVVLSHDVHVKLLLGVLGSETDHLLHQARG